MTNVRTSLEVGFPEGRLPARYAPLRGRVWRSTAWSGELPFEDAQFEVVIIDGASVSRESVKEAHRVLRADGRLYFAMDMKRRGAGAPALREAYALVRDGFHIVGVERSGWWRFWRRDRSLTICAKKKAWKSLSNTYRPYL